MRRFVACSGLLLLATAPACLLYTDPINSAPKVTMIAPATVHPHERVTFKAQASDPDGDAVSLDWYAVARKCAEVGAEWGDPTTTDVFTLEVPDHNPFCVRLVARDRHGASVAAEPYQGIPVNRVPVPTLTVDPPSAGSFPLYTNFRLTAAPATDEDEDPVTFTWKGVDPTGAEMELGLGSCDPPRPDVRCFSAVRPGMYSVTVMANDGRQDSKPVSVTLPVLEDAPPCIEVTDPSDDTRVVVLPVTGSRSFEVRQVRDDGNPLPPGPHGGPTFQWLVANEGSTDWVKKLGFDRLFPVGAAGFEGARPGSSYRVRVEVRDPQHESMAELRALDGACHDDDVCELPDKCVRWVTWTVRFQ